ncbi:hypothetical protein RI129_011031 [Pyrocoelia pectoralis]|uniref:Uncharacterized protein n=1 Tax=Pyrocoelia pectoralis TaxID=417401 RepID=A0AAN7Z9X4_9COLE
MKILLVIATIFPAIFAFSSNEKTQEEHPECLKSSGAKVEYVNQYWNDFQLIDDENFKCYIECVFSSFHLVNDDGIIDKEEFVQDVDKATNDMVDFCNGKVNKPLEKCELFYELLNCLLHFHHIFV